MAATLETLYQPMVGATDEHATRPAERIPEDQLQRTVDFHATIAELKVDLGHELEMIDCRLIHQAMEARQTLKPMQKVVKKREDKKVGEGIS